MGNEARINVLSEKPAPLEGWAAVSAVSSFFADPVNCVEGFYKKYGDTVQIRLPFAKTPAAAQRVLYMGPAYNRAVLGHPENFRPSGIWPVSGKPQSALEHLRRNPLCLRGEEHDAYVDPLMPFVNRARIKDYFEGARAIAAREIKAWPVGADVEFTALAKGLSQQYGFQLLFGENRRADIKRLGDLIEAFHYGSWSQQAMYFRVDAPFTDYGKLLRAAEELETFVKDWGARKKTCPADENLRAMAHAVRYKEETPSPEQIAANLVFFSLAAYETSANTLSWVMFLLSQHPKIFHALAEEVDSIGDVEDAEYDALMGLPLLDAVLKESMRLFAPGAVFGFEAISDCEVGGIDLHNGARVFLSAHVTHRLPELYENPREFRPERWATIRPNGYEYLPFSAGPRRCPGLYFATNNLKIAIAFIASRYKLEFSPGAVVNRGYAATTISKNGLPMRLLPRDGKYERAKCSGDIFKFFDLPAED